MAIGVPCGRVPVGAVLGWNKSLANTPVLTDEFAELNGQVEKNGQSVYYGVTYPNFNGASGGTPVFLRGGTTSGATGGSETHNHTVTLNYGDQVSTLGGSQCGVVSVVDNATDFFSTLPTYNTVVWIICKM